MIGPDQEPKDEAPWQDWQDHKLDGKTSGAFVYNPDAAKITPQSGSFSGPDDVEAPEKM